MKPKVIFTFQFKYIILINVKEKFNISINHTDC